MFDKARIKLTAWYLIIIMCVSAFFSCAIYRMLSDEVERFAYMQRARMERKAQRDQIMMGLEVDPPSLILLTIEDLELVTEAKNRLVLNLIFVNGVILVASGGLGYLLAGKTLRPIKHMVDEQNRFVGDASHEFRTPLTSLKTAMEVFMRSSDSTIGDAKVLVQENILEVNKLQRLAEDLLYLAQNQKPQNRMRFDSISTSQVVKSAIEKTRLAANQKNITIQHEGKDHITDGSSEGLIDVLVILLDNAVKYSPENSMVTVETQTSKDVTTFIIKDTGMGIDKKDILQIFDRFYRADDARHKTSAGGYGLGLSIAKQIVDLHKGTITVESKPGKGSTFYVHIPKIQNNPHA